MSSAVRELVRLLAEQIVEQIERERTATAPEQSGTLPAPTPETADA